MAEIGTSYVNILPRADGFSESVAEISREAGQQGGQGISGGIMDVLNGTVQGLFGTGGEMGSALSGGMEAFLGGAGKLAIGAAVAAIGVEAVHQLEEIGAEIDAMTDEIIVGTGASGETLEEMRQIAMQMSGDVAVSFGKSGDIVQDFSTRLGLSGDELQTVATHAAELEAVLGGFNYDNMATMFNVWGVGAADMNASMDYLFGVAQSTGIGFDQLTSIMQNSGPTLQNLGFTFEESANMAGLLDRAGIDASSTMTRMSRALVELSEPGESAQDAFRRTVDEMQAFIDAGDTASALDLASEVFGTRGAAQFIGALQSGALSLDAISDAALGAGGSISDTYSRIESWPQMWERIKSSVGGALEPLASGVFEALGAVLDGLGAAMDYLWQAGEPARAVFADFASEMGERLAPVMEALSPVLEGIGGVVGGVMTAAFQALVAVMGALADAALWLWDNVLAPFGQFLAGVFGPAADALGGVFDGIASAVGAAGEVIGSAWETLSGIAGDVFGGIADTVGTCMDGAQAAVETAGGLIVDALNGDWDSVAAKTSEIWATVGETMGGAMEKARGTVVGAADAIGNALGFPGLGATVDGVFRDIEKFMEDPVGNALAFIQGIPDEIIGFFQGLGGRISEAIGSIHFPSPHVTWDEKLDIGGVLSIPLPHVEWYASGGFVDEPTVIGAGEAGAEMVLPMQGRMMDAFADELSERIGGASTVNIYLDYDAGEDAQQLVDDIARRMRVLNLIGA